MSTTSITIRKVGILEALGWTQAYGADFRSAASSIFGLYSCQLTIGNNAIAAACRLLFKNYRDRTGHTPIWDRGKLILCNSEGKEPVLYPEDSELVLFQTLVDNIWLIADSIAYPEQRALDSLQIDNSITQSCVRSLLRNKGQSNFSVILDSELRRQALNQLDWIRSHCGTEQIASEKKVLLDSLVVIRHSLSGFEPILLDLAIERIAHHSDCGLSTAHHLGSGDFIMADANLCFEWLVNAHLFVDWPSFIAWVNSAEYPNAATRDSLYFLVDTSATTVTQRLAEVARGFY